MIQADIYVRYSQHDLVLDRLGSLTVEKSRVYQDEGLDLAAHGKTAGKFSLLTAASPLFALARVVRSVAFAANGQFNRAGREFIGGTAVPLVATVCLTGTLASALVYVLSGRQVSFYVQMRRTYARFEAWINRIDLDSSHLATYSKRVSDPLDFSGRSNTAHDHVWTTAPCMQPILERGYSKKGGIMDAKRMQRLFPLIPVRDMHRERGHIVIGSSSIDEDISYEACGGACEHSKRSYTCCCCYRIEMVYSRFFCCEVGQGSCTSLINPGNSCGIAACGVCGLTACCCYEKQDYQVSGVVVGCVGPGGSGCVEMVAVRS